MPTNQHLNQLFALHCVVGLAVSLSGCNNYLKKTDIEAQISDSFKVRTGLILDTVTCPDKEPVKKGRIFQCEGILSDSQSFAIHVTQIDDQSSLSWDVKDNLQDLKGLIDNDLLAKKITDGIKVQTNIDVITDCGGLFRIARKGESFICTTTDAQENQTDLMVKVQDDDGNVSWGF